MLDAPHRLIPLTLDREGAALRTIWGAMSLDEAAALEPHAHAYLAPEAQALLARLTVPARRAELLCGQWLVHRVARAWLGDDTRARVGRGAFGQPLVQAEALDVPDVTLSHAGGWVVALAFPHGHPIGIDLERVDAAHVETLAPMLGAAECAPADHALGRAAALTQLWALKEAVSKATLCGLVVKADALALEAIGWDPTGFVDTRYATFRQYRGRAWVGSRCAFAIALPFRTEPPARFPWPELLG